MNININMLDIRLSDAVELLLVVGTFAIGVIACDAVPTEMVVHYTPPGGVYYGLETPPKQIGLFIVSVITVITFVVARTLLLVGDLNEALASVHPYYQLGIVLLVTFLVGIQVSLVLLNVL